MAPVWTALQSTDLAVWIGFSRWAYAAVATAHVLAVAALVGAVLTLDLRLMGLGRSVDLHRLAGLAVPIAGTGLACAVLTGGLLFIGRAAEYAAFDLFRLKMVLIVCAVALSLAAHRRYGFRFERATARQCRRLGIASLALWVCVAVSGRMIAFVYG